MALTDFLGIAKLIPGTQQAHPIVNDALVVIDKAIAGIHTINLSAVGTVNLTGGESTNAILRAIGATAASLVVVQNVPKTWTFINDTSFTINVQIAGQAVAHQVLTGQIHTLVCDGIVGGAGVRRVL